MCINPVRHPLPVTSSSLLIPPHCLGPDWSSTDWASSTAYPPSHRGKNTPYSPPRHCCHNFGRQVLPPWNFALVALCAAVHTSRALWEWMLRGHWWEGGRPGAILLPVSRAFILYAEICMVRYGEIMVMVGGDAVTDSQDGNHRLFYVILQDTLNAYINTLESRP